MSDTVTPGQAATPGHPLDLFALAAFGAFYSFANSQAALGEWKRTTERERERWRSCVDAARMMFEAASLDDLQPPAAVAAQPAPELAAAMAETREVKGALAVILDLFAKGSSGYTARISQVNLARAYRVAGVPIPSELVKFL